MNQYFDGNQQNFSSTVTSSFYCIKLNSPNCGCNQLSQVIKSTEVLPFYFNKMSYQKVVFPGPDFICLFYSSSEIKWKNGNKAGVLRSGGVAVFDCQKLFTYTVSAPDSVCFIFIPYQLYDRKTLKIILEGNNFIYADIILSIIK